MWTRATTRRDICARGSLGALLAEALTEQFNDDWYRNPRAGPWIVEGLFAEGQRELADEIAQRVAGRSLSFGPVIKAVERLIV